MQGHDVGLFISPLVFFGHGVGEAALEADEVGPIDVQTPFYPVPCHSLFCIDRLCAGHQHFLGIAAA